jgi:hypothetical protein
VLDEDVVTCQIDEHGRWSPLIRTSD